MRNKGDESYEYICFYFFFINIFSSFFISRMVIFLGEKQESNNQKINNIAELIRSGANTFLRKEYIILAKFALILAIIIFIFLPEPIWKGNILDNITITFAYIFGTIFSAFAGKIGMFVATIANKNS